MIDFEVKTFKNENIEMDYLKFGSGNKNMIVIPGISLIPVCATPAAVISSCEMFSKDYTVYLFDRKKNMERPYHTVDMAKDTLEVIKSLGLKDLYIYGASQGGNIALHIAIIYPKLVKKLLIASSSYYMNGSCFDFFSKINGYVEENDVRSLASYMVRKIYSKEFCEANLDILIKYFTANATETNMKDLYVCTDTSDKYYLLDDLDKITAKVMLVASKLDDVFGYEPTLHMALKLNCDCVIYDEYSHAVYDEAPDFRDRMKEFFDK